MTLYYWCCRWIDNTDYSILATNTKKWSVDTLEFYMRKDGKFIKYSYVDYDNIVFQCRRNLIRTFRKFYPNEILINRSPHHIH
jgi:hypothetical protein